MKNKGIKVILLASLLILLVGCSRNDIGSFGPAWDVAVKVPLVKNETKTVKEMLKDANNPDIVIPSDTEEDTRIAYEKLNQEMSPMELGQQLTDVKSSLPKFSDSTNKIEIALEPITVTELTKPINQSLNISGGISGPLPDLTMNLGDSNFSEITFANDSPGMKITISNPTDSAITVDKLTFIFKDDIKEIGNKPSLAMPIDPGDTATLNWNLAGQTLADTNGDGIIDGITISTDISTSGTGTNGSLNISFSFPEVKVQCVVGLASPDINETMNDIASINLGQAGLEEIAFSQGQLQVAIEEATDLDFSINELKIGNDADNSGVLEKPETDLSAMDGIIDLTTGALKIYEDKDQNQKVDIGLNLNVSTTKTTINYDATQSISLRYGFSDNTTIDSVTVDSTQFDLSSQETEINQVIEMPEEDLSLISLPADAVADLTLDFYRLAGVAIDLSQINVEAKDVNNNLVKSVKLATLLGSDSGIVDPTNPSLSLLHSGEDFIDWLQALPAQVTTVNIVGTAGVAANDSITIYNDSKITPKTDIKIPFDFKLNEDYAYKIVPGSLNLDELQETLEQGERVIKEVRLVIEELNNQLPMGCEVEVYVGQVSDWTKYDHAGDLDEYLNSLEEDAKEIELAKLYNKNNLLLDRISIERDTKTKKEVVLTAEDGEIFTKADIYAGVKIIIPQGDITLNSTDLISIKDVYTKLVLKVNQGEVK